MIIIGDKTETLKATRSDYDNLTFAIRGQLSQSYDITIIAEDGELKFNRMLLSIYSPLLRHIFSGTNSSSTILLPDYPVAPVKILLDFLIFGISPCEMKSSQEIIANILEVANILGIKISKKNLQVINSGTCFEKVSMITKAIKYPVAKNYCDAKIERDIHGANQNYSDSKAKFVDTKEDSEVSHNNEYNNNKEVGIEAENALTNIHTSKLIETIGNDHLNMDKNNMSLRNEANIKPIFLGIPDNSDNHEGHGITIIENGHNDIPHEDKIKCEKHEPLLNNGLDMTTIDNSGDLLLSHDNEIDFHQESISSKHEITITNEDIQIKSLNKTYNIKHKPESKSLKRRKTIAKNKIKRFSKNQVSRLQLSFNEDPFLSKERAKSLKRELGLTEKQISKWFERALRKVTGEIPKSDTTLKVKIPSTKPEQLKHDKISPISVKETANNQDSHSKMDHYKNAELKKNKDVYEVTCKELRGEFHLDKFIGGGKGISIFFNGSWMTPNAFEKLAGSRAKKYKESLHVNGKPIKEILNQNCTGQNIPRKRKISSNTISNLAKGKRKTSDISKLKKNAVSKKMRLDIAHEPTLKNETLSQVSEGIHSSVIEFDNVNDLQLSSDDEIINNMKQESIDISSSNRDDTKPNLTLKPRIENKRNTIKKEEINEKIATDSVLSEVDKLKMIKIEENSDVDNGKNEIFKCDCGSIFDNPLLYRFHKNQDCLLRMIMEKIPYKEENLS